MWDHRSLASPPPPDSGGNRSRASENQVSHTPRWFSNHLKPSSLKQLHFFCNSAYDNPPLIDTDTDNPGLEGHRKQEKGSRRLSGCSGLRRTYKVTRANSSQ